MSKTLYSMIEEMMKRLLRIWIYLTQWMPYGWKPNEMTENFWRGK